MHSVNRLSLAGGLGLHVAFRSGLAQGMKIGEELNVGLGAWGGMWDDKANFESGVRTWG